MIHDYDRIHHRKPGYREVLEILRCLLELANQPGRPGCHLEARKIRHRDRAPYLAWDQGGNRTTGATPKSWTEFALGWVDGDGAFEGPPGQFEPASTWENALIHWARALAADGSENLEFREARAMIVAMAQAAEARRGQPHRTKAERAAIWLKRLFSGTRRTEIPAAEIFRRARALGIAQNTLIRAKRTAGFRSRERRENNRSYWLWTKPTRSQVGRP